MKLTLSRKEPTDKFTKGEIILPSGQRIVTLELPWLGNQHDISCIPYGTYQAKRINSPHFGEVFEICNVPNREHILIHKGNVPSDTKGCILLGMRSSATGILESKKAFDLFMQEMKCQEFELKII